MGTTVAQKMAAEIITRNDTVVVPRWLLATWAQPDVLARFFTQKVCGAVFVKKVEAV